MPPAILMSEIAKGMIMGIFFNSVGSSVFTVTHSFHNINTFSISSVVFIISSGLQSVD